MSRHCGHATCTTFTLGLYNASCEVWRLPGLEDPLRDFDKKCLKLPQRQCCLHLFGQRHASTKTFQLGQIGMGWVARWIVGQSQALFHHISWTGLFWCTSSSQRLHSFVKLHCSWCYWCSRELRSGGLVTSKVCASERLKPKPKRSGTADPSKNPEEAWTAQTAETQKVMESDRKWY